MAMIVLNFKNQACIDDRDLIKVILNPYWQFIAGQMPDKVYRSGLLCQKRIKRLVQFHLIDHSDI